MPSSKKNPHPPQAPTPSASGADPSAGLGDLMGGLIGGILEQVKQLAGWVGHPLARPLDAAEAMLTDGTGSGKVTSSGMARGLAVQIRGLQGVDVHLVGHSEASVKPAAKEGPGAAWVVIVGDDTELDQAFASLKAELSKGEGEVPPCHNVVFWSRKWDASAWARAFGTGLGALASKPLWAKLWDANGTLVGPVARAPPPLLPVGDLRLEASGP